MSRKLNALVGFVLGICLVTAPAPAPAAATAGVSGASDTLATPVVATPVAAEPTALPAGQLEALRRDLDLTADQLAARLTVDATAPSIERRMRAELADAYAGTWITADGRTTVVGLTDPALADQIRAVGAEPRTVTRSLAELRWLTTRLDRRAARAGAAVHAWHVAPASNTVAIQASNPAAATSFARAAGLPNDAVSVVVSDDAYRPVYDIRGGDQYVIDNRLICSVGFAVAGGFVTAGHCGNVGEPTSGSGVAQGTVRGSSFPGDDYGWVQTNATWTPRPWVSTHDGNVVTVTGSQEAAVGASVCRSGGQPAGGAAPSPPRTSPSTTPANSSTGWSAAPPVHSPGTPAAPSSPAPRHRVSPRVPAATAPPAAPPSTSRSTRSCPATDCH